MIAQIFSPFFLAGSKFFSSFPATSWILFFEIPLPLKTLSGPSCILRRARPLLAQFFASVWFAVYSFYFWICVFESILLFVLFF
jgi:hypothetical protein